MHLVGFIIRIYHDARSPERQSPGEVVNGMTDITNALVKMLFIFICN